MTRKLLAVLVLPLFIAPASAQTNLSTIMSNGSGMTCTGTGGSQACTVTDQRLLNATPGTRACVNAMGTQQEVAGASLPGTSFTRQDGRQFIQSAKVPCLNPQVIFGGFIVNSDGGTTTPVGEAVLPNDFYLSMNWEYPSGTNLGIITYLGQTNWDVLPSLSFALTDKSGITIPASSSYYLRLSVNIGTTSDVMVRPNNAGDGNNGTTNYGYQVSFSNNSTGQQNGTGPLTVATASSTAWAPITIVGTPQGTMTAVGWIGDSLAAGFGDTVPNAYGDYGYLLKGFDLVNTGIPRLPLSRGSSQTIDYIYTSPLRVQLLQYIDWAIYALGTNDIAYVNASATTLEANTLRLWNVIKGQGKPITAVTLLPRTTSTYGLSTTPTIASGGTGYAANSTFNVTLAGGTVGTGTGQVAGTINVTTNGSGVVTTVNSYTIGYYTTAPSTTNSPTGGSGSGLSLTCTYGQWLDQISQTPLTGFTTSSTRDIYNAWLYTQLQAGVINDLIDTSTGRYAIGSAGTWVNVANTYLEDQNTHSTWATPTGPETTDGTHISASTGTNGIQRAATLVAAYVTAKGW